MKKIVSLSLILVFLVTSFFVLPVNVLAAEVNMGKLGEELNGYRYEQVDGHVWIDKYLGNDTIVRMPEKLSCTDSWTNQRLMFPVRHISPYAFSGNQNIKEVYTPDSLYEICSFAFSGCKALEYVYIGEKVDEIGDSAFTLCDSLKKIRIPDSVRWVRTSAFKGCSSLSRVTFSDNLKIIESYAFQGCSSLESVVLTDSLNTLGSSAFDDCTALKSVTFGSGLKTISTNAFSRCRALTNVVLSSSIQEIDDRAFLDCSALKNIVIPQNVEKIGEYSLGYFVNSEGGFEREENFTIFGYKNSTAQIYANENGFNFVMVDDDKQVQKDEQTQVMLISSEKATLTVKEITEEHEIEDVDVILALGEKIENLYDISLVYNDTLVQPSGEVRVMMPCNNPSSKVYRVEDDDSLTDMNATFEGGQMVFTTDHFSVYALVSVAEKILLIGDANFDGIVNIKDASIIQKHTAKILALDEDALKSSDVNNDNEVNIKDATTVQKYVANINTGTNIGEPIIF